MDLPTSVSYIGTDVFQGSLHNGRHHLLISFYPGCTNLTTAIIPTSTLYLGFGAFQGVLHILMHNLFPFDEVIIICSCRVQ